MRDVVWQGTVGANFFRIVRRGDEGEATVEVLILPSSDPRFPALRAERPPQPEDGGDFYDYMRWEQRVVGCLPVEDGDDSPLDGSDPSLSLLLEDESGYWSPTGDLHASRAYAAALFEADRILREVKELDGTGAAYMPARSWRAADGRAPAGPPEDPRAPASRDMEREILDALRSYPAGMTVNALLFATSTAGVAGLLVRLDNLEKRGLVVHSGGVYRAKT